MPFSDYICDNLNQYDYSMNTYRFIAFDLGATSGRTILGTLSDNRLTLEEVTRFPNQMLQLNGHYYWNIFSLYENLKKGLAAVAQKKIPVTSAGIDTWGVDFAFVAPDGSVMGLPFAYRDPQTIGKKEEFFEKVMPAAEGCPVVYADRKQGDRIYNRLHITAAEPRDTQPRRRPSERGRGEKVTVLQNGGAGGNHRYAGKRHL